MERDCMEFDVLIVGAGPAGLSAACRIKQLAAEKEQDLSVCVVEKGSEVGAHILSGAVFETRSLDELFPDWQEKGAPLNTKVNQDKTYYLGNDINGHELPSWAVPNTLHNKGNYIISLGSLCRWMALQAENLGGGDLPRFYRQSSDHRRSCLWRDHGRYGGVRQKWTKRKFRTWYTASEVYFICRRTGGHIGKQLINRFNLAEEKTPQHYAIGFKELWEIPSEQHQQGLVVHGLGWPLSNEATGGSYLYHLEGNQVAVGLIVDLNYKNPHLSPFDEFQRFKHHPLIEQYLKNGKRISYGARAITKGGFHSLPTQQFAGGLLIGCDAGTLNGAKIKGTHTAIKSGMLAAEAVCEALESQSVTADYQKHFKQSWLYEELYQARNFSSGIHRFGSWLGGGLALLEHNVLKGKAKWHIRCDKPDHQSLLLAESSNEIVYPKPDGVLSFDRLSSVYLSNIFHEEDQPCHLRLENQRIPIEQNLELYAEPAQRYCPAGVYEIVQGGAAAELQINAANCIHCKTCDIKDPSQNITWTPPEGGGGPNYPNM
ncbi:LOW QUALITY PROTEIN: electron transfer flavoprotein-ubiquinone oxidoreductase [Vibrio sp. JCM 18904]|nr:LOW QUALITY PROTEIN: electron transfer flavoprotein-ubiquinone oxidoreductase [Vibrio sp. JCM 18904]